jgi:hypothetical protein
MSPWRLCGEAELFGLVRPALEEASARSRRLAGALALGAERAYLKASPLAPRPALRHALRRAFRLADLPRLQEFANLAWLRARGFRAARPLLAGAFTRAGLPRYQFLVTAFESGAEPLGDLLPRLAPLARGELLAALARDLARLHALGFVHRDLFPRNLLVRPEEALRCIFLDTWRSPPGRSLRGPEHDLGCLMVEGAGLLDGAEQRSFLDTYRRECASLGRALAPDWPARVEGARRRARRRAGARSMTTPERWAWPEDAERGLTPAESLQGSPACDDPSLGQRGWGSPP